MRLIEIIAHESGAHRSYTINIITPVPEGWAVIPEEMELPSSYPYVDIEVEDGVVTAMTARERPKRTPVKLPETNEVTWDVLAKAYEEGVNSIDE
jgi:hypothetical protein